MSRRRCRHAPMRRTTRSSSRWRNESAPGTPGTGRVARGGVVKTDAPADLAGEVASLGCVIGGFSFAELADARARACRWCYCACRRAVPHRPQALVPGDFLVRDPEKPAPALIRRGHRFSDKITHNKELLCQSTLPTVFPPTRTARFMMRRCSSARHRHPFDGQEKTNVEEYCVSEGWIRVAAGKSLDRKRQPADLQAQRSGRTVPQGRAGLSTIREGA